MRIARDRMNQELNTTEGSEKLVDETVLDLRRLVSDLDFAQTARELHRQATVLVSSAIEVFGGFRSR